MRIHPEKLRQEFENPGIGHFVNAAAQLGLPSADEPPPECKGADARMKVVDPLTSTGPSLRALVVYESASALIVRFPRVVFVGALVQVRTEGRIVFGKARGCTSNGSEYEINIEKREIY